MFQKLKEKLMGFLKKEEEKLAPKLTTKSKLAKAIKGKVKIKERDIKDALEELEFELIESDVALPVAEKICEKIKEEIVGKEVDDVKGFFRRVVRNVLESFLPQPLEIPNKKPLIILFVGPNGHGKTTTLVKIGRWFKDKGKKVVFAAADTFRAASIEQLETLAKDIGPVIKHKYGADPAAVAYDAVNYAKAHHYDVVLIDTAGRSERDKNLMEQLRKIVRVVNPDLKIFVGEAMTGHAFLDQLEIYDDYVDIDGVVITKVDLDVKGGNILSLGSMGKKIWFLGCGQGLGDIMTFDRVWFLSKILPE